MAWKIVWSKLWASLAAAVFRATPVIMAGRNGNSLLRALQIAFHQRCARETKLLSCQLSYSYLTRVLQYGPHHPACYAGNPSSERRGDLLLPSCSRRGGLATGDR